jgi:uncharacterized membrane protein
MNRQTVTVTLAAAAALVMGGTGCTPAGQPTAATQPAMEHAGMEKCYGIALRSHNDCASVQHSCAGQASIDMDPGSFVYLPVGMCGKISGGKLTPT